MTQLRKQHESRPRTMRQSRLGATVVVLALVLGGAESHAATDFSGVKFEWLAKIPMRDGVELAATVYQPADEGARAACIFTLTPYTGQTNHAVGEYFAAAMAVKRNLLAICMRVYNPGGFSVNSSRKN
jgi:predicted acyl esterase